MDWVGAAIKDSRPLPLRSSLAGIERVAKTISIFWEAFFSLRRGGGSLGTSGGLVALGAIGGLVTLGATPLVVSISFSTTPGCSAYLEGLSKEKRALAGLSLPIFASSKTMSALDLEELDAWMVGG